MKTKQILALILSFLTFNSMAQTKLIAHKSHSGSSENFKITLAKNVFNDGNSNFGVIMPRYEKPEMDSVILKNDSTVRLISKFNPNKLYLYSPDTTSDGKDRFEIYIDPKFSEKNPLDSIKKELKKSFQFDYKMDSVKYKGFEIEPCPPDEEENSVPFFNGNNNNQNPPSNNSLFWLSALAGLLSLLFTLISFRLWQLKNQLVLQYKVQSEYFTN